MKFDPEFQCKIAATREYAAIGSFYGERRAERSKVLLMNHIDQGIAIIGALGGRLPDGEPFRPELAARAYCLHPLFQNDEQLLTEGMRYLGSHKRVPAEPVAMAMEYRWRANNWLSDKVQNYKDFLAHHAQTHDRSIEPNRYFGIWIRHLGVHERLLTRLFAIANEVRL